MKTRSSRSLIAASLATLVLGATVAGCKTVKRLNPFSDNTYTLDIVATSNLTAQLQSLYVIVSPKEEVMEPLTTASKYGDLLDEDRINKYVSFVQYQPTAATEWKMIFQGNPHKDVQIQEEGNTIGLKISHSLVDSGMVEYRVIVLGFYGSDGFELVEVMHDSLDANADQVVQVSGGSLTLSDAG